MFAFVGWREGPLSSFRTIIEDVSSSQWNLSEAHELGDDIDPEVDIEARYLAGVPRWRRHPHEVLPMAVYPRILAYKICWAASCTQHQPERALVNACAKKTECSLTNNALRL